MGVWGEVPHLRRGSGGKAPSLGSLGYALLFGDFPHPKPVSQCVPLDQWFSTGVRVDPKSPYITGGPQKQNSKLGVHSSISVVHRLT